MWAHCPPDSWFFFCYPPVFKSTEIANHDSVALMGSEKNENVDSCGATGNNYGI